jgi:uncharacterized metal-binding protein YceD (DUF177 family)
VALPLGLHVIDYQVKGELFSENENSSVRDADLKVKIKFNKSTERLFELEFIIKGTVMLECDRCLEMFEHKVAVKEMLYVKLGTAYLEEADNTIVWPENQPVIDLAPHIYDYVELKIPLMKTHPLDKKGNSTCNEEMLKKLDKYLIENNSKDQETDPRWDQLKDLLN